MVALVEPDLDPILVRWRGLLPKLLRYAGVSAIATAVTLTLLGVLVYTRALTPGWANLVATAAGTIPSFELNRRWVWAKQGRRSAGELIPFWSLSFLGLALSTLDVGWAGTWARQAGLGHGAVTLVAELANLATFGTLWILQYLMLDRFLFRTRPAPSDRVFREIAQVRGPDVR